LRHFFAKNDYSLESFFREKRSKKIIIINPTPEPTLLVFEVFSQDAKNEIHQKKSPSAAQIFRAGYKLTRTRGDPKNEENCSQGAGRQEF
jgi:hypothetical protein